MIRLTLPECDGTTAVTDKHSTSVTVSLPHTPGVSAESGLTYTQSEMGVDGESG